MSPAAIDEAPHGDIFVSSSYTGSGVSSCWKGGAVQGMKRTTFLFDRHLHKDFPVVEKGQGSKLYTKDGRIIFDATSGAAVSCLGHGNKRVIKAVCDQMASGIPYLASGFFGNETVDDLCEELIKGTDHKMARVYLTGSGRLLLPTHVGYANQNRIGSHGSDGKASSTVLLRAG
jgi:4-aminobutyrate aminotransferase-like enzyme